MGGAVRTLRAVIAVIAVPPWSAVWAGEQRYRFPENDVEIVLRFARVDGLLGAIRGAGYAFTYHNNGTVCSNPNVSVKLDSVDLEPRSVFDLAAGKVDTSVGTRARISTETSRCVGHTIKVQADCRADLPLVGPSNDRLDERAKCHFDVENHFTFDHDIAFSMPFPLALPSEMAIRLPGSQHDGALELDAAFVESRDGRWRTLPAPLDKERRLSLAGYAAFSDARDEMGDPNRHVGHGARLTLAATAGRTPSFAETSDPEDALERTTPRSAFLQDDPSAIAFLRIHESLLAPPTAGPGARGLLGSLFPLMLNGTYRPHGLPVAIGFSLVVDRLSVRLRSRGDVPVIEAALHVDQSSLSGFAGPLPLTLSLPSPDLVVEIARPRIDESGQVRLDFERIDLDLGVQGAGLSLRVPIGGLLKRVLDAALPSVAALDTRLVVTPPECIATGSDRVEALSPCRSHGDERKTYMGYGGGGGRAEVVVDLKATKVVGRDGAMDVEVHALAGAGK